MVNQLGYGSSLIMGKCLHWLMLQMACVIQEKKQALRYYKPGAITDLEPKLIWMKMLETPNASRTLSLLRAKFNVILEQILHQTGNGLLLDPSPVPNHRFVKHWFDPNGNMFHQGKISFWKYLDEKIRRFDIEKKGLDPHVPTVTDPEVQKGIECTSYLNRGDRLTAHHIPFPQTQRGRTNSFHHSKH